MTVARKSRFTTEVPCVVTFLPAAQTARIPRTSFVPHWQRGGNSVPLSLIDVAHTSPCVKKKAKLLAPAGPSVPSCRIKVILGLAVRQRSGVRNSAPRCTSPLASLSACALSGSGLVICRERSGKCSRSAGREHARERSFYPRQFPTMLGPPPAVNLLPAEA